MKSGWFKNLGAPHRRPDGSKVPRGGIFQATEDEAKRYAYKLQPVPAPEGAKELKAAVPPVEKAEVGPTKAPPTAKPTEKLINWTLKLTPSEYLERYPNGPNADAARRLLGGE
jgi:hypothetical protein